MCRLVPSILPKGEPLPSKLLLQAPATSSIDLAAFAFGVESSLCFLHVYQASRVILSPALLLKLIYRVTQLSIADLHNLNKGYRFIRGVVPRTAIVPGLGVVSLSFSREQRCTVADEEYDQFQEST